MTIRRRKLIREKGSPQVSLPSAQTQPADTPPQVPAPAQINANPDVKEQQTEDQPTAVVRPAPSVETDVNNDSPSPQNELQELPVPKSKFSLLQKALIAGIILSAAFLTYSLVQSSKTAKSLQANAETSQPPSREAATKQRPNVAQTNLKPTKQFDSNQPGSETKETSTSNEEPLSLQMAENYYTAKNYDKAFIFCSRLRQNLPAKDMELIRDFLQLRMALCLKEKGDFERANKLFRATAESRSIVLQVIANYHSCLLEMDSGQYLKARTRAYKVMALTGALTFDEQWPLTLERDCTFLAAEAITRQLLTLCDADKDLPRQLWNHPEWKDPLTGLDETKLQALLSFGIERLSSGLLAPQVHPAEQNPTAPGLNRWIIICNGPGIEELMARFASNASLDVKWIRNNSDNAAKKLPSGWNRPVIVYLPSATTQQVAITAAGAVGLLAQVNEKEAVQITDPAEYSSLSEHTRALSDHATWLWRKLLLMSGDDARNPNVHFVLGILQSQKDQMAEAIAEYKLVANRYSQTPLAPFALLHSSRIKSGLRNYEGASGDLKQLIEQYPDNELIGQAHLDLAETTMKAGLFEQACTLYKKAYNLGFSTESKTVASFGAGKCFYQLHDYESAIKWLNRYLDSVKEQKDSEHSGEPQIGADLYTTYLMLGKAHLALGNVQEAAANLQRTIRKASDSDEYVEAVSALVETQIKQQDFLTALNTIENTRAWPFTQEQITRLLLLKSAILREIGLTDKVITMLSERAQYITDPKLKANIIAELARCYCACGKLENARKYYIESISLFEAGPLAQQASLELANVCLKLGDYGQTISICTQLLNSSASQQIKEPASKSLAAAYSKQQQYDKAAQTLLTASIKQ